MNGKKKFFFSKGEKNGILVLICLIVVTLVINRVFPYYFKGKPVDISACQAEIEEFNASLERKIENPKFSSVEVPNELFRFDPNKLDSTGFIRLGIPPYMVTRIIKYRTKGGIFQMPDDFAKIYGMKESLYEELRPYIHIENLQKNTSSPIVKKEEKRRPVSTTKIELNCADATTLKKLKGIGTVYAERIVKYRESLGGFYRIEQLKEVYGISEELFLSLIPFVTVDTAQIKKIRLNHDLNSRFRHPYLKKEQLSALISFQQKNQTISSFEALKELSAFSDENWERLMPYLSLK